MTVVPVPFRDAYAFGGSLHCATTDVYREGECEDYFPKHSRNNSRKCGRLADPVVAYSGRNMCAVVVEYRVVLF